MVEGVSSSCDVDGEMQETGLFADCVGELFFGALGSNAARGGSLRDLRTGVVSLAGLGIWVPNEFLERRHAD